MHVWLLGMFDLTRMDLAKAASKAVVMHHVANGGCGEELKKAMYDCNTQFVSTGLFSIQRVDPVVDACVKATAALRECFAGNPEMFKHQYLRRMDDPDNKLSCDEDEFRWWAGMRRS